MFAAREFRGAVSMPFRRRITMKSYSVLLMAVVATLFALTSLVEVTQAAPLDAGWKIRGSGGSSYSARRFSGPVYRSYSAPAPAETARGAETERRSFSLEPAPARDAAPAPVYRDSTPRSRGSSKPEWSQQKMLRNS
jgi:hypothetical protein